MKHSKKEWLLALIHGFICGVIVVVLGCLALHWFRYGGGAELLGFGAAVMP